MELDDMKLAWQELGAQLERQHSLGLRIVRDHGLDKVRRGLRPLMFGQVLQVLLGAALSYWAASFWATHLHSLHLLVCGLLVQAYGILLIVLAGNNLYRIHRIDHTAPLLEIQRRLAELRAFRVRVEGPLHGVLGWFVRIPVTLIALAGAGIDLWSRGVVLWAVACSLFGLAAIWSGVWLMRRRGWGRRFDDNSAGRSVTRAQAVLEEIARFERE